MAGVNGFPISSSSSSFVFELNLSTSDQSRTLLLDANNTRKLGKRSMPA